jgi:hypothetical protein
LEKNQMLLGTLSGMFVQQWTKKLQVAVPAASRSAMNLCQIADNAGNKLLGKDQKLRAKKSMRGTVKFIV